MEVKDCEVDITMEDKDDGDDVEILTHEDCGTSLYLEIWKAISKNKPLKCVCGLQLIGFKDIYLWLVIVTTPALKPTDINLTLYIFRIPISTLYFPIDNNFFQNYNLT